MGKNDQTIDVTYEYRGWWCDCCGSGNHVIIKASNGDSFFNDGQFGSTEIEWPFGYYVDEEDEDSFDYDPKVLEKLIRQWYWKRGININKFEEMK